MKQPRPRPTSAVGARVARPVTVRGGAGHGRTDRRARRSPVARLVGAITASAMVTLALGLVPSLAAPASAASSKITICHRTHSTTNPYRRITVSQNAVTNARHGGHQVPSGSSNPAVYDSTFTYASNNKVWGDVIPGSTSGGAAYNGSNAIALNWTAAGIADFDDHCGTMTAKAFYDSEIAAGETAQSVIDDLNEQAANEDAALLASIGGSFSTSNVTSWDTAVSVTSSPAASVGSTTATLNGTITVGSISTAVGFDYGTSPTLATFTSVSAGANVSSVSSQAISKALTGLTSATTYYFRATGTTNAGSDTEGILYGSILSFTTTGSAAQSITFDQPVDMALGGGTQTLTSATADTSGLPVTFTSSSTGTCTVSGAVVTAVDAGTCSITASQAGDATYGPAAAVTRTFSVTATSRTLAVDGASYDATYAADATPPTITSTASAGDADGTKSYTSTTPAVCTVGSSTGIVVFVSAGTCTIGAAISAGGGFGSATASSVDFAITAASRTLTIDPGSYAAGGYPTTATPPTITSTASAGSGAKTYRSTTTSVCTINPSTGVVVFVGPGSCTIGASIAASGSHGSATAPTITFGVTSPAASPGPTPAPPSTPPTTAPPSASPPSVPPRTTPTTAPPTTSGRVFEVPSGAGQVTTPGGTTARVPIQLFGDQITVGTKDYGLQIQTSGTSTTFANATITLVKGSDAVISGFGFKPGTIVHLYILSTPTDVGTALVTRDGTYSGNFKVPAGLADGQHSINSVGTLFDGTPATVAAPVSVKTAVKTIVIAPFAFDSARLTPALKRQVRTAANIIKEYRVTSVTLLGYTDPVGSSRYNLALSRRRSAAVRARLEVELKALGYRSRQIRQLGLGRTDFVYKANAEVDHAASRRVAVRFDTSG